MKTCLIVDDSRMIRRVASRIVRDLGFETSDAINGQDALDKCLIEMPDAILVDWAMPVMDGFDFVKKLRDLPGGDEPTIVFAQLCGTSNALSTRSRLGRMSIL